MNELVLNNQTIISATQKKQITNAIVCSVDAGNADLLTTYANIVQLEKALADAKDKIRNAVESELMDPEKDITRDGARFTLVQKKKFLFDGIEEHDKQVQKIEQSKKKLKRLEEDLIEKGLYGVDYSNMITVKFD
jgi:lipoate-protein ligase A